MPVTVLAFVSLNEANPWALAEYFRITGPGMQRAGARIVKRFSVLEPVIGRPPFSTVIMAEFPTREAVDELFNSEEYQRAIPMRDQAFSTFTVTVVDDPAAVQPPRQGRT